MWFTLNITKHRKYLKMKYWINLSSSIFKLKRQINYILKYILTMALISIITLLFIFTPNNSQYDYKFINRILIEDNKTSLLYWQQWLEPFDFKTRKIPQFDQFILLEKMNGQLGNQVKLVLLWTA